MQDNYAELVLVVEDADAPLPRPIGHLTAANIAPSTKGADAGALVPGGFGAAFGRNSLGRFGYQGPRPVKGHGNHYYVFQLFAAAMPIGLPPDIGYVCRALADDVVAAGFLTGTYVR